MVIVCLTACSADTQLNPSDGAESTTVSNSSNQTAQGSQNSNKTNTKKNSSKTTIDANLSPLEKMLNGSDKSMTFSEGISIDSTARIGTIMNNAKKGGEYTIAVIGGSISKGKGASSPGKSYVNIVLDWWKKTFPKAKFKLLNLAIDGTTSEVMCYQLRKELLANQPDFVIVDFGLDPSKEVVYTESALEGIYYTILDSSVKIGLCAINFADCDAEAYKDGRYLEGDLYYFCEDDYYPNGYANSYAQYSPHELYKIPVVDYHTYIRDKIHSNEISWKDIAVDQKHPNDNGHKIAANLIIKMLEKVKSKSGSISPAKRERPKKALDTTFCETNCITNTSSYVKCEGFTKLANNSIETRGWRSNSKKENKLIATVPERTSFHLIVKFDKNAVGVLEVVEKSSGRAARFDAKDFDGIEIINLLGWKNELEITAKMTSGEVTILTIGTKPYRY